MLSSEHGEATAETCKKLIPKKALDNLLARLLMVPKAEVDAAVAKPIRRSASGSGLAKGRQRKIKPTRG